MNIWITYKFQENDISDLEHDWKSWFAPVTAGEIIIKLDVLFQIIAVKFENKNDNI